MKVENVQPITWQGKVYELHTDEQADGCENCIFEDDIKGCAAMPDTCSNKLGHYWKEIAATQGQPQTIFQKQYHGFESSLDIEDDIMCCLSEDALLLSEFTGTLTVTITYKENNE